jgi:hypothetical protein
VSQKQQDDKTKEGFPFTPRQKRKLLGGRKQRKAATKLALDLKKAAAKKAAAAARMAR